MIANKKVTVSKSNISRIGLIKRGDDSKVSVRVTNHARNRIKQRELNYLEILGTLAKVSPELLSTVKGNNRILVVSNIWQDLCIVVEVHRLSDGRMLFLIITCLDTIPSYFFTGKKESPKNQLLFFVKKVRN